MTNTSSYRVIRRHLDSKMLFHAVLLSLGEWRTQKKNLKRVLLYFITMEAKKRKRLHCSIIFGIEPWIPSTRPNEKTFYWIFFQEVVYILSECLNLVNSISFKAWRDNLSHTFCSSHHPYFHIWCLSPFWSGQYIAHMTHQKNCYFPQVLCTHTAIIR